MSRPAIPVEMRRNVLIEAGHRCAIPTCKATVVDIHHIEPYEIVKCHEFDNLIALCTNCHRRAHNGEIDKKSLYIYKKNLQIQNGSNTVKCTFDNKDVTEENFNESTEDYDFNLIFPHFMEENLDDEMLNTIIKSHFYEQIIYQRSEARKFPPDITSGYYMGKNKFSAYFQIRNSSQNFVAIEIISYKYHNGTIHGCERIYGMNYWRNPLEEFELKEIFENSAESVAAISKYCISTINLENNNDDWDFLIESGAGPNWDNFSNYIVTEMGVEIVFNPYHVGPYPDGIRKVLVPYRILSKYIPKESRANEIWYFPNNST